MGQIQQQRDEISDVCEKLKAWGEWLRATSLCNLDYPKSANFTIMPGGRDTDYENTDAEMIEQVLVHLKRESRQKFNVIMQDYYFLSSAREGAAVLGLSRTKYCDMKSQAENFVFGYLLAIKKSEKLLNIA